MKGKKRLLGIAIIALSLNLVGCGPAPEKEEQPKTEAKQEKPKKEFTPKEVGELNIPYRSTREKASNGSNAVINISKAEKIDNKVVVRVGAPGAEEVAYAYKNYLAFDVLNSEGKTITTEQIEVKEENGEVAFYLTGKNEDAKWVAILPYKGNNGDYPTFEIK